MPAALLFTPSTISELAYVGHVGGAFDWSRMHQHKLLKSVIVVLGLHEGWNTCCCAVICNLAIGDFPSRNQCSVEIANLKQLNGNLDSSVWDVHW